MRIEGIGLRGVASNALITLGRHGAAAVLQLGIVALIAWNLGPEGNGQYAISVLVPATLATLLNLGLGPANIYFLGVRQVGLNEAWWTMLKLGALLVTIGMLVGSACVWYLGDVIFPGIPAQALWLALAAFPATFLQQILASLFRGLREYRVFNLMLIAMPATTLAWIATALAAGLDSVSPLVGGYCAGALVATVIGIIRIRKLLRRASYDKTSTGYSTKALRYGYKAHLSNIIAVVIYKADIFLINLLAGSAAAGLYVIAIQFTERLWILSKAVTTVAFPELAHLSGQESVRRQMTPILTRAVVFQTMFGAAVMAGLAYPVIRLIFGLEYVPSVLPLLVLLPGAVAWAGARVLASDISARGRPEFNLYLATITAVSNVAANLLLIPAYGILGAAFATTMSYILYYSLNIVVYRSWTGASPLALIFPVREDWVRIRKFMQRPIRGPRSGANGS